MQQRGASLVNVEALPSSNGAHEDDDDSTQEVEDKTPRFIRCLPKPLQFLFLSLVGCTCLLVIGPFVVFTILFLTPSTRRTVQEYAVTSDIVLGRVMDRTKHKWKFCYLYREAYKVTLEYNVGESTYRKTFGLTKKQYDDANNKYGISKNVELLVISGLPKSAMIKETIETLYEFDQGESWWQLPLNVCFCLLNPMFLTQITSGASFWSWDNFVHGCALGLVMFVIGAWLFWLLDLVGKQEKAFKDTAELVGADDDDADVSTLPNDSLTAPLLSAVTGF